jgi:hypothetical protein
MKRHIDGTVRIPPDLPAHLQKPKLTEAEEEELEELEKRQDEYDQRESMIKAQIFTTIPESLIIEFQKLETAHKIWEAVCARHEKKALTIQVDVRRRMYEMKCQDESNVRKHLEALAKMQEQLASMDAGLSKTEFVTVILGSLPKSYRPVINSMSMSASFAKVQLEPDTVISNLIDEFERLQVEERQLKAAESALAITKGRGKGNRKDGGKSKENRRNANASSSSEVECWKCGEKGHVKFGCRNKAKKNSEKEKSSEKSKSDDKGAKANTAVENDEYAFTATFAGSVLSRSSNSLKGTEVDIYDSGASSHMSPDRHRFVTFKSIPPRPIKAADHALFNATGVGTMKITMPNGDATTSVTLQNVLYCQDLAFTLISLSCCDKAGFTVLL